MNKKSRYLSYLFLATFVILASELVYLYSYKSASPTILDEKKAFVSLSGLPDLALSSDAYYTRHRTLSTLSSIYGDDGALREYTPSSFAISHSHILNSQERE